MNNSMARSVGSDMATGFARPNLPGIQRWTRGVVAQKCARVQLNVFADGREVLVRTWDLLGLDPEQVAEEIDGRASDEGRTMRGPALFALYAYNGGPTHVDRKQFRIEGESFPRTGETEPPDASGIIGMLMRHSEAATKIALGHTTHIIQQYQGMLAQSSGRVSELEDALQGYAQLQQKIATNEHEYRLVEAELAMKSKRQEQIFEKGSVLVPVLMEFLLGKQVKSPVISDEQMKELMQSLTPEQLSALATILRPEQAISMMSLYTKYAESAADAQVAAEARKHAPANAGGASQG